jgi:hypothetical protein
MPDFENLTEFADYFELVEEPGYVVKQASTEA